MATLIIQYAQFQLIGIGVGSVSSWVLHRAVQAWKNPTLRTATTLLSQVNTFFGGTTGLYDLEVIYRIITACSAVALVGGFVQFLMSFWLLLAASQVRDGLKRETTFNEFTLISLCNSLVKLLAAIKSPRGLSLAFYFRVLISLTQ